MAITGDCKSPAFRLRRFESYFQHQRITVTCRVAIIFWWNFTKPLEPILARSAEAPPPVPAKLERAPPEKPFAFLRFPPAEFLFLVEKGVSGGSLCHRWQRRRGSVGIADELARLCLVRLVTNEKPSNNRKSNKHAISSVHTPDIA